MSEPSESVYVFICPSCGRGNLYDNFCEDCVERGEFSEFVPVERIAELKRHNGLLLNTIADDNKHLAEKNRVIALLRAVAEAGASVCDFSMQLIHERLEPRIAKLNEALNAAVDGGALDGDK